MAGHELGNGCVVWGLMVLVFRTFVVSYWRTSDETMGVGNSCDALDNCGVWDKCAGQFHSV